MAWGLDYPKVCRLAALSDDCLLGDISVLMRMALWALPDRGLLASPVAHRIARDPSVLDRLYHVGLIHLYCDPPCSCGMVRHRRYYTVHAWPTLVGLR